MLIATDMVEVFPPFLNGTGRAYGEAGVTRAAIPNRRGTDLEGEVGEDGQQANPCPESLGDKKIVPADPADSCRLRPVFVREMASLALPIDKLGGRDGNRPKSEVLNGAVENKTDRVEKDVDPLIVLEIERGRSIFDIVQDGIGEMVTQRDRVRVPLDKSGGEKDPFPVEGRKISHPDQGASPLPTKGLDPGIVLENGHGCYPCRAGLGLRSPCPCPSGRRFV